MQPDLPAKPSDTVNTNTCVLVFLELCVYQREPPFNDLLGKKYMLRQKTTCESCVDGINVLIWTRKVCFSRGGEKFVPKQLPE